MHYQIGFLLSDGIYLILLFSMICAIFYSYRKKSTQMAFLQLILIPKAVCTGVILLFFLLISVLDSVQLTQSTYVEGHWKQHTGTVLDTLLSPLDTTYETSYSKPFALNSLSANIVIQHDKRVEINLPLTYPKQGLTLTERNQLMIKIGLMTVLLGITLLLIGVFWIKKHVKQSIQKSMLVAWVTMICLLMIAMGCFLLSREFHVFGTGKIGQDIFYHTIKSIRTGLFIGLVTTVLMLPFAIFFGMVAGYFGGLVDDIVQYIYTTVSAIPGVLLISASVLSMQIWLSNHPNWFASPKMSSDMRLILLCSILGLTSWTSLCRLIRGEVLKYREMEFIWVAKTLGSSQWYILRKHLLPNVIPIVIITVAMDMSYLILAEAVLSYVGVGVSHATISWGNMINSARLELARTPLVWWPMFFAFLTMFTLVLSSNLFADSVRDVFSER